MSFSALAYLPSAPPTSQPKEEEIPPLKPAHAKIPPAFWEQHHIAVAASGLVLLGLIGGGVWAARRQRLAASVPPEVQARKAIESLHGQTEDGVLLSRVSQTLKQYLGAVFSLPPGELTTSEFCHALTESKSAGQQIAGSAGKFLKECDTRKFSLESGPAAFSATGRATELINLAEARREELRKQDARRV